jgi:hypothetical protein
MPGKTMLVYAMKAVTGRTDVLPWLLVLVSNLGALLMYRFVRDLLEDSRAAVYAAVLYLLMPARVLFFPLMNTVTPVVVLGFACLLLRCITTGRLSYGVALGVALYALVFFEPLPLVMGLLFAVLVAGAVARRSIPVDRLVIQAAAMIAAFIATAEALYLSVGFDLLRAFTDIGAHAVEFNKLAGRSYAVWVQANLWEFLFGAGVCQVVMLFGVLAWRWHERRGWRERLADPASALCAGLLAVLITTDLLGVNRGEVIRLWIFLACFVQIPAAYACAVLNTRTAIMLVIACTALQATIAVTMMRFVSP